MNIIESITDNRSAVVIVLIVLVALAMVAVAAVFFIRLLRTFRVVHDQFMPLGGKIAFWAALAYTILPIDVLPDPILFDDIGVLALALAYINQLIQQHGPPPETPPESLPGPPRHPS